MKRCNFLATAAALAASSVGRAQTTASREVIRFVPAADMPSLDPVWTAAAQTRDHASLVYNTLHGLDEALQPQPQMVAGHEVEDAGRIATQQRIARDIQAQAFVDVSYIPTGMMYTQTAYRPDLTGALKRLPAFWNVRRA